MVDPALFIALPLGAAFLLPLIARRSIGGARALHLAVLAFGAALAAWWLSKLGLFTGSAVDIETGGWAAPLGILLRLGGPEAGLILLADAVALLSALYMWPRIQDGGHVRGLVIQLMILLGAHGLILTRDLFNLFVFIEIVSIGSYAIVLHGRERVALEAGLKYMLVGAVASVLILLATGLLYRFTGTLTIDIMAERMGAAPLAAICLTQVLLMVGFLAELKLFPVNGPAIDLYEGADPGVMALLIGTAGNAIFFAFTKVFMLYQMELCHTTVMAFGMGTYVISNLLATRQTRVRRLLGYSSSGQIGLLVFLWPMVDRHPALVSAVALLLVNHTVAKAGLLWIVGVHGGRDIEDWAAAFRRRPFLGIALIILVLAIVGLPPFPGFWGKWDALVALARDGEAWGWIVPLLIGAFLEWVYYFGWARKLFHKYEVPARPQVTRIETAAPILAAGTLFVVGLWFLDVRVLDGQSDLMPAMLLTVFGAALCCCATCRGGFSAPRP